MTRRVAIVVLLALTSACAARQATTSSVADLARADQLAAGGCYRCLQGALAIYERQIGTTRRPAPALVQRALETAALAALREKELGIPSAATVARVRALALQTSALPGHLSPDVLLELIDLAPAEASGMDPDDAAARNTRERRERLVALRPSLASIPTPTIVETYLALSLDCDNRDARTRIAEGPAFTTDNVLLRYKLAVCVGRARTELAPIRAADPRWTDTTFFEARAAVTPKGPDLRAAIGFLTVAQNAFPESPAVIVALAHAQRGYGDLEPALATYDRVIKMVPGQREALLGRTITLAYLERHPESVETATRMVDLGTWLLGDAYYWRARGRYILKALEAAWDDAEHAVKLSPNTNVFTLAGVIAHDRRELDVAKDRFQRARQADNSNCTAHFYYATVVATQNSWSEATPIFSQAMSCFTATAGEARRTIDELRANSDDPVFTARLIADQERTLKEAELKAAQSAYNAAQGLLRAGNTPEARTHLQLALDHPDIHDQAAALQKLIKP